MSTKAKLTVILKANDVVVAEVDNAELWQQVLAVANQMTPAGMAPTGATVIETKDHVIPTKSIIGNDVSRFAKSIGVTEDALQGALNPTKEPPYFQLDRHCWAAMKKNTPQRGSGALNPTALAGTLLALWLKEAGLGVPATQALALEVLKTIDVTDTNSSRGIKNTKWLQARSGGAIVVNPAEIAKAQDIAKAFCTKQWPGVSA